MPKQRLMKNKKGTAEIVGTALFLVILFFFFSNVFLWHNQVSREMDQVIADKMNSAVRIETTIGGGEPVTVQHTVDEVRILGDEQGQYNPSLTNNTDETYRIIKEHNIGSSYSPLYELQLNYTFDTTINSHEKLRLVASVGISVYATFDDSDFEGCHILIVDCKSKAWIDTGLLIVQGLRWSNISLLNPERYIDASGHVKLGIADFTSGRGSWGSTTDSVQGTLKIDYMEVRGDRIALKITNLGGLDVCLSRLWIINSTETTTPESDHLYADFEPLNIWISPGSQRIMALSNSTTLNGESLAVAMDRNNIKVQYVPPAGKTIIFKIITKNGNTVACSYSFRSD